MLKCSGFQATAWVGIPATHQVCLLPRDFHKLIEMVLNQKEGSLKDPGLVWKHHPWYSLTDARQPSGSSVGR